MNDLRQHFIDMWVGAKQSYATTDPCHISSRSVDIWENDGRKASFWPMTQDYLVPCLWDMTAKKQSKKQKLWCSRGRSGNNFPSFTCSLIATSSLIIYSVGEYSKVPKVFWVLGPAFWDMGRIWQNTPVPIRVTLPNLVALGQIIWAWVPEIFEDGGPRPFGWRTWLTPGKHASPRHVLICRI